MAVKSSFVRLQARAQPWLSQKKKRSLAVCSPKARVKNRSSGPHIGSRREHTHILNFKVTDITGTGGTRNANNGCSTEHSSSSLSYQSLGMRPGGLEHLVALQSCNGIKQCRERRHGFKACRSHAHSPPAMASFSRSS
jgi:hypothetical protein